jgi:predicted DNA binding CopG/RHH family protein
MTRKDKPVCIRVTKAELAAWRAAAAKDGRTLSSWIRVVTNKRGLK